jgi:hypothetical protein
MKITRTQKDAVISLLKEKFDAKQKIVNEQFEKERAAEISVLLMEYNGYIEAISDAVSIINEQIDNLENLIKNSDLLYDNQSLPYIDHEWHEDRYYFKIKRISNPSLKYPQIERPDFNKVSRQLELDTLSKDFNVEEFLKKYLEN